MKIITIHRHYNEGKRQQLIPFLRKYMHVDTFEINLKYYFILYNRLLSFSFDKHEWRETTKKNTRYFKYLSKYIYNNLNADTNTSYNFAFFFEGLYSPIHGSKIKLPYIVYEDTNYNLVTKMWPGWIPKSARYKSYINLVDNFYKNASHVFTATDILRDDFINHYKINPNKVTNVHMGANLSFISKDYQRNNNYNIIFVGYEKYRKGIDVLLKAFKILKSEVPSSNLFIVGLNNSSSIPGVRFLGNVKDRDELRKIYLNSSIFVMPSRYDPVPTAVLEAFSMKLAVVVSNTCGSSEYINNGISGYIFENENYHQLYKILLKLCTNQQHLDDVASKGYQSAYDNYKWDTIASNIYRTLDEIKKL